MKNYWLKKGLWRNKRIEITQGRHKGEYGTVLEYWPKTRVMKILLDKQDRPTLGVWDCYVRPLI